MVNNNSQKSLAEVCAAVIQHQNKILITLRPEDKRLGGYWEFPGGIQKRLHLHARQIRIPHPDKGMIDVSAPLPPHMVQTFNLLAFDLASAGEDDA